MEREKEKEKDEDLAAYVRRGKTTGIFVLCESWLVTSAMVSGSTSYWIHIIQGPTGLCCHHLFPQCFLFCVVHEGVFGVSPNCIALVIETEWDRAAGQAEECDKGACPLVTQLVIHLASKQHDRRTPHGSQKGFGGKRGSSLVLVGVHCRKAG
ncbi:hypothetical protein I7I48_03437 [Histoplasma ohiense]|nr:hypothetical protein I7I48_03437 [Histoplasma ohiense (nom. inval.)]